MNQFLSISNSIKENFLGRICTILTNSSALPLKDYIQHSQYYTGEVVGVDESGVWIKHPQNSTLAFFCFPIQGIVEEQYIPANDPRHEKIKEEISSKKEKAVPKPTGTAFIDTNDISARIRAAKNLKPT